MAEYIEREAALNADFKISVKRLDRRIKTARDAVQAYANYIAHLPAADVHPVVHGRWVEAKYPLFTCSECGATYQENGYGYNYCPNCGAKMEVDDG